MTNVEIDLGLGFAGIRFGMTPAQVRAVVNSSFHTFRRGDDMSRHPTDAFAELGVYVEYTASGECEAIELAWPSDPLWKGNHLIGRPAQEVADLLKRADPDIECDRAGATSYRLNLGFYAPSFCKEPDEPVESVIVFRKGYYDKK